MLQAMQTELNGQVTGLVQIQPHVTQDRRSVEELRAEVASGFVYSHRRANANTSRVLEVAAFSYAAIELMIEKGLISVEELDERKRKIGAGLVQKFNDGGLGIALLDEETDKYTYQRSVEIDCQARLPLCRAACCRLTFPLSVQDVEEGKVRWEMGRPYMNRRDADGYCHHLQRGSCRCGVYEARPLICRGYDCRGDKRIWTDFENRVASPDLAALFPEEAPQAEEAPIA
jgi:Fe-S-cluster containining protein